MGYHDDVGVAKEDMEDGIDLMDTDNEDAEEEEEDSEEERRVAEGFIEDAAFAETLGLNPEVLSLTSIFLSTGVSSLIDT